jgi:hypothetical protein|tara:strand:- start:96 stop:392 length:297 start_codon:yes stop_codon:yes gene_type:complete
VNPAPKGTTTTEYWSHFGRFAFVEVERRFRKSGHSTVTLSPVTRKTRGALGTNEDLALLRDKTPLVPSRASASPDKGDRGESRSPFLLVFSNASEFSK